MLKRILSLVLALALLSCMGLAETAGQGTILSQDWDLIGHVPDSENYIVCKDGKWGMIDAEGKVLLEPQFEVMRAFEEGTSVVCKDGKWGMIDTAGNFVLEAIYYNEMQFVAGFAKLQIQDMYGTMGLSGASEYGSISGVINRAGEIVIPVEYDWIELSDDGQRFVIKHDGKFGVMNAQGEMVVDFIYDSAGSFVEGYLPVSVNIARNAGDDLSGPNVWPYWGIIDSTGKVVVDLLYGGIVMIGSGLAVANLQDEYGIIDMSGNVVVPFDYTFLNPVQGQPDYIVATKRIKTGEAKNTSDSADVGYASVYGVIDKTGKVVIPLEYEYVTLLPDGLVEVRPHYDRFGYLDLQGQTVIEPKYVSIRPFVNDLCIAMADNNMWGMLNRQQEIVLPFEYDAIKTFTDGIIRAKKGLKEYWFEMKDGALVEIEKTGE